MSREMMVHVTPFEVHAAILEDGALAEYHVERRKDRSIVGNIYKGRVGKVLPGMQSAFVDIGIEKNAFLYVTDFFEEFADLKETLDVDVPKGRAAKPPAPPPPEEPTDAETAISAPPEGEDVETATAPAEENDSAAAEGPAEAPKKRRRSRRSSRSRSRSRAAADATAADSESAEATPASAEPPAETVVEPSAGTEDVPAEAAATPAEPSWTSPWAQPAADPPEPERDRTDSEDGTATIRFPDSDLTFCASRPRGGRRKRKGFNLAGEAEPGNIATMLKQGQEIIVQVMKEPMSLKSARITSHISLPGRQLVFLPTVNHVGVSRKIHSDQERKRLRTIITQNRKDRPGGFIIRTASEGLSEAELVQDMEYLMKTWEDIQARGAAESAPCLLYEELDLVEKLLRDKLDDSFQNIWVDDEAEYAAIVNFVERFMPTLLSRVKLYSRDASIFDHFNLTPEIQRATRQKVWLPSGGFIVVNHTEALVAIDVNSGKYVGKGNSFEETITKINVDAAKEAMRQVRLRNLGGIIVIDFIDMQEKKSKRLVLDALTLELRKDKVPTKVIPFNDFGMVIMTRKRSASALEKNLSEPCSLCGGSGFTKSVSTICYEIYAHVARMRKSLEGTQVEIRAHPNVIRALKSIEREVVAAIEKDFHRPVVLIPDSTLELTAFDIVGI